MKCILDILHYLVGAGSNLMGAGRKPSPTPLLVVRKAQEAIQTTK